MCNNCGCNADPFAFNAEKKNCGCGQDPCITYGAESFVLKTDSGHEVEWDDGSFYMTFKEPIDGYGAVSGDWYGGEKESPDEISLDVEPAWDEENDDDYDVPSLYIQFDNVEYYGIRNHNMTVSDDRVVSPELSGAIQEGVAWMVADHADKTVVSREYKGESFAAEKVNFVILGSKDIEGVGIVTEGSPYLKNYYGEMDEYNIYDDDAAEEIMSIPVNDPRYPLKKGEMRLIEAMVYGFNHPRINDSRGELNEDGMFWAGMVRETLANYSDSPAESFGAESLEDLDKSQLIDLIKKLEDRDEYVKDYVEKAAESFSAESV